MKKRYIIFGGAIVATILATAPLCATGGYHRQGNGGKEDKATVYVDTADVDSVVVDASAGGDDDEVSSSIAAADTLPWPENVVGRIEEIFDKTTIFNTSMVGMKIYDLTADSTIYERNAQQLLRPASTLKMMVAVAALDRLGADYQFQTSVAYTGSVDSLSLNGDIYCKGGFDPTLANDDVSCFADSIKALGIDTIRGDVFLDMTMKDKDRLGEGWCWDDDNPMLSPLVVGRKDNFGERLMKRLRQRGIMVTGECKEKSMPASAHTICTKLTALPTVMHRQLKRSDNLYSEAIFYQLAADAAGRGKTATAKYGRQAMNRLVSRLGFKPSAYYIADGSGLSLYNYVSPELEVAFLRYAYQHTDIYNTLRECLPIAGVDGTLDDRMTHGAACGNVRAKTGTVTGISSLAGYCTAANGHVLCFSIINTGIRYSSSGKNFQNKVCQALCK